jgi:hypothetical protein
VVYALPGALSQIAMDARTGPFKIEHVPPGSTKLKDWQRPAQSRFYREG